MLFFLVLIIVGWSYIFLLHMRDKKRTRKSPSGISSRLNNGNTGFFSTISDTAASYIGSSDSSCGDSDGGGCGGD